MESLVDPLPRRSLGLARSVGWLEMYVGLPWLYPEPRRLPAPCGTACGDRGRRSADPLDDPSAFASSHRELAGGRGGARVVGADASRSSARRSTSNGCGCASAPGIPSKSSTGSPGWSRCLRATRPVRCRAGRDSSSSPRRARVSRRARSTTVRPRRSARGSTSGCARRAIRRRRSFARSWRTWRSRLLVA